jgi:hypothetical protein
VAAVIQPKDSSANSKHVVSFYRHGFELVVELLKAVRECRLQEIHSTTSTEEGYLCHTYTILVRPK